ncbi:hypothetical protein [Thalassoroseus pseudoceratinae]|uniref:hypothetical protein n=1 Tax=Thalassoroseus pseudoceratinae TaxID=2713176 RepID=UPI00142011DB|nr:hypothetical protein [Thalassoroseus pseudoceratinae]
MSWIEQLLNDYGKMRLAGEAKDLQDNHQILAMDRAAVDAHNRRNFGSDYRSPADSESSDMIHIGDHHQHLPPRRSPSRIWPALLGAGLLASGVGGGVGLTLLWNSLKPQLPEPVPQVTHPQQSPDEDTLFELQLGPPQ